MKIPPLIIPSLSNLYFISTLSLNTFIFTLFLLCFLWLLQKYFTGNYIPHVNWRYKSQVQIISFSEGHFGNFRSKSEFLVTSGIYTSQNQSLNAFCVCLCLELLSNKWPQSQLSFLLHSGRKYQPAVLFLKKREFTERCMTYFSPYQDTWYGEEFRDNVEKVTCP